MLFPLKSTNRSKCVPPFQCQFSGLLNIGRTLQERGTIIWLTFLGRGVTPQTSQNLHPKVINSVRPLSRKLYFFISFRTIAEYNATALSCLETSLEGCSMRYIASIKLQLARLAKCEVKLGKMLHHLSVYLEPKQAFVLIYLGIKFQETLTF